MKKKEIKFRKLGLQKERISQLESGHVTGGNGPSGPPRSTQCQQPTIACATMNPYCAISVTRVSL